MKLQQLTISNFRCFGPDPVTIDVNAGVTAFIGNNGSGKTAVFAALARLFGVGSAQRTVRRGDFHVPVDRNGPEDGITMAIDCSFSFPEFEAGNDDEAVPEVFGQMSVADGDGRLLMRMRLQANWTDNGTPDGVVEEDVRWVRAEDDFVWEDCRRVQGVERGFVQLVYVPASRNAYDQVTNLLKGRLWRAARWSGDLHDAISTGAQRVQEHFDEEGPATFITERLTARWAQVHQGDTDATPRLRVADATLDEVVRRAEFVLDSDPAGQVRQLEDLSDGQRSLFHIALTAATLEIERDALAAAPEDSPFDQERLRRTYLTLLAIEEPENSLSPFFLSRIMVQARELAALPTAQVLISSHSASILSRIEPVEVRYLRHDQLTRRSRVSALSLPADGTEASTYVRLAVRAYPELYFARFVILAEGESEAIVIPRLAEAMGMSLDRSFVPIVPLAGRFVRHFWRLLNGLGIPYATLLDLDAGRRHGGAGAIAYVVSELGRIGRDMASNRLVLEGVVDPDQVDDVEDADLVEQDQNHPWLRALRREGVYFSSPLDIDFAMLGLFEDAYRVVPSGGRGPRRGEEQVEAKKAATLKTGGTPAIYDESWDEHFAWYPYLFVGGSKPATHLMALGRIDDVQLVANAPPELTKLLKRVRRMIGL